MGTRKGTRKKEGGFVVKARHPTSEQEPGRIPHKRRAKRKREETVSLFPVEVVLGGVGWCRSQHGCRDKSVFGFALKKRGRCRKEERRNPHCHSPETADTLPISFRCLYPLPLPLSFVHGLPPPITACSLRNIYTGISNGFLIYVARERRMGYSCCLTDSWAHISHAPNKEKLLSFETWKLETWKHTQRGENTPCAPFHLHRSLSFFFAVLFFLV
mmetsp:Transcript_30427/g.78761  ORF Transcript_30427/g.78761 Transcript_30427/m.78761 type:complete len:215 (+) Transcript_30427:358-1002(+)